RYTGRFAKTKGSDPLRHGFAMTPPLGQQGEAQPAKIAGTAAKSNGRSQWEMESDYGALFGDELEHGAEVQDVAEPAENKEDPADAGAEGQEVAEPAAADSQEQTVAETAAGNQDGLSQEQQGQSAEENA